jgi:hypothetical protein
MKLISRCAFAIASCIVLTPCVCFSQQYGAIVASGTQPLEGITAELNNAQDLRDAASSSDRGISALDRLIFNEGVRRARGKDKIISESGQKQLEAAEKTLRMCKASCRDNEEHCLNSSNTEFATLFETGCKSRWAGQCQLECTQTLRETISEMPDPAGAQFQGKNQALEQQRQIAAGSLLINDFELADHILQLGTLGLQKVALAELIRITLGKYKEYGVPNGQTMITAASANREKCLSDINEEEDLCIKSASLEPNLLTAALAVGNCVLVANIAKAGCSIETVTRVLGGGNPF